MDKVIYPWGKLPVEVVPVSTTANVYKYTVTQSCILNVLGTAFGANGTLELTAHENLRAGSIIVAKWLGGAGARTLTPKPTLRAAGEPYAGQANKASSVTLMYTGETFLPISHIQSIEVA